MYILMILQLYKNSDIFHEKKNNNSPFVYP